MSLRGLLELESRLLDERHETAMRFAESAWMNAGSPRERRPLIALLESVIVGCNDRGLEYPSVILKRKKQLERGDWTPRKTVAASVSHHPAIPAEWIKQAEEAWRNGK
jgi:hypothetical protein